MVEGGRGPYPALLKPGARVSSGALLQSGTSSIRALRCLSPAALPAPARLPARPPRPRAPPPGGLRRCQRRRAAEKAAPALRCGRRPRPRRTSGGRAPAAAAPRSGAVSQQNANARGGATRSAPGHRGSPRSRRAGPGRAARAESAGGAPRRTARWRPRPPSCRCVGPGCWAVEGSPLCAGDQAGWLRSGAPERRFSPCVPGLLARREDRKMGSGAAPLPGSGPLRALALSSVSGSSQPRF